MPFSLSLPGDVADRLLLEFRDDVAAGGDAFADAEAVRAADERIGILDVQVVEVVAALVADAQHVLEAVGRDEAGLDALAFQNRVRDHRGRPQNLQVLDGRSTAPNRSRSSVTPCTTASAGFLGVLRTLWRCSSPLSSRRAKSVKVPPVSKASFAMFSSSEQFDARRRISETWTEPGLQCRDGG